MNSKNYYQKKRFGQHWLVNKKILEKIKQIAVLNENDFILEIGPGKGALTSKLLDSEIKNISYHTNIPNNDNLITDPLNSEDPNKIFYSLIDNSESLEETANVNNSLRKSELNQISMNSRKTNFSKKLTTEEELNDEFNYLLDE